MSDSRNPLFGLTQQAKTQLLESMRAKSRRREVDDRLSAAAATGGGDPVPLPSMRVAEKFWRFEKHPIVEQLLLQKAAADRLGIDSPYFRRHEAVARNVTTIDGRVYVNYSNYNYLDLSGHPEVNAAAVAAIEQYGTSASASRPVSGEKPIHRDLERAIADIHQTEDCVVFVSGHATNVTTIGHLFGPKDLILHDSLIHNSAAQGALLSGATRRAFPHNDWRACDQILKESRRRFERVIIVLEGIYSMDGDTPDLARFVEIRDRHKVFLMVDEAHSMGVLGEDGSGIRDHCGIAADDVDIWMGTLSKSFAGCGGYIAGSRALVECLKFSAPGFVYSVGMPPSVAAASIKAIEIMRREPERVVRLRDRGRTFLALCAERGLDTGLSEGYSVIPVITGGSVKAARLANRLFQRGINVQPIVTPAVEERAARLRFFLSCAHTDEQLEFTANAVADELAKL